MKITKKCPKGHKTRGEKEKLLVKSLQNRQTRKIRACFGKRFKKPSPENDNVQEKVLFENTVGKGENGGNKHFLLFPQCFFPFPYFDLPK